MGRDGMTEGGHACMRVAGSALTYSAYLHVYILFTNLSCPLLVW